jgi:hypothetical protein
MTGSGKAVVCAVGKNSRLAELESKDTISDDEESFTPLQKKLGHIAD